MSQVEVMPLPMIKVANGVRLLGSAIVDATNSSPVKICTTETSCKVLYVIVERKTGGALTLVTGKMGFNASNNDVLSSIALNTLSAIGLSIPVTLNSPSAVGTPGQDLNFQITVTAGTPATILVSAYGTDG